MNRQEQFKATDCIPPLSGHDFWVGWMLPSVVINLFHLFPPLLIIALCDRIIPHHDFNTLATWGLIGLCITVIQLLLKILSSRVQLWHQARVGFQQNQKAFEQVLHADFNAYRQQDHRIHFERLQALEQHEPLIDNFVHPLLLILPFEILFLSMLAGLSAPLFYVALPFVITLSLVVFLTERQLPAQLQTRSDAKERKFKTLYQLLNAIHTIKSLGMEGLVLRKFSSHINTSTLQEYHLNIRHSQALNFSTFIFNCGFIALMATGSYLILKQNLTLGTFIASLLFSHHAMQPWLQRLQSSIQKTEGDIAAQKLNSIFQLPKEKNLLKQIHSIQGNIQLVQVGLRDAPTHPWLFQNVNLEIKAGETLVITSHSDLSKSKLLAVIAGLQQPSSGHILIDGQDIYRHSSTDFRQHIGYLTQHGTLFSGTILENITLFQEASIPKAKAIAEKIGLDRLVEWLPEGYQTTIGHETVDPISRGLKQLIIIARSLLRDPKIILFDSANTALDQTADSQLKNYLQQLHGQVTLLMISNRPSFLQWADRTFNLDAATPIAGRQSEVA